MTNYLKNDYIKATGKYKYPCPYPGCDEQIPYYQLSEVFGAKIMEDIENQFIADFMENLVTCVKCKSKFDFSKGRPSDAPRFDSAGNAITSKYA